MEKAKIKINFLIAVIVVLIILLLSSIATFLFSPTKVFALTNTSSATAVANGVELFDDASGSFNSLAVVDLNKKLFAEKDPISYIKSNKDIQTDSYVIPASTINTNVGNEYNGLVLTLGSYQWIVSAITLTDSTTAGKEDIVVTLYMANSTNISSIYYSNNSDTKGNNAYSRSDLRNNLLTNSSFAQFVSGSFAEKYLVQPKNVKYQHTQSWSRFGTANFFNLPNDALHNLTTGWPSSAVYVPGDIFTTASGDYVRYDDWGNDYIWIPSISEIGGKYVTTTLSGSIWDLSANQLGATSNSWLRSGNNYNQVLVQSINGSSTTTNVADNNYIRPAIHLNLSEVIRDLVNEVENPQDLTSTYNTKTQTLSEIVAANKNTDWYDKNIYEKDNEYLTITYPNATKVFENAGEYWVKAEIKEEWINKVYAQVDTDAQKYSWTSDQIAAVKEKRKPKFIGTADTSDSSHLESDTVRWIKITINKAEIDFSKVKWSADSLEYNALNQSVTIKEGLPSFLTPTYSGNTQLNVNTGSTFYTAKVEKFTSTNSNYRTPALAEINTIPQLQHKWKITKKKIQIEWDAKEESINGITLSVPKLKIEETYKDSIEYTYYTDSSCTTETTLEDIFANFDITTVKSYWIKAQLKSSDADYNSSNSVLVLDGAEVYSTVDLLQTGATNNSVIVEIVNKKVTFNGSGQQANFKVSGSGLTEDSLVIAYQTELGVIITHLPKNAGKYKAIVKLKDGLEDYTIVGQKEFEFEIESLKVNKPEGKITKTFKADGFELNSIMSLPKDWSNYFEIKVYDKDNNEIDKTSSSWTFFSVNEYRIEIKFKNGMNTNCGGEVDNVIWHDNTKGDVETKLAIQQLVFKIEGWQNGEENDRATLKSDYNEEIEKYFDYVIYECKGDITIGEELGGTATLKYETNYQIALRVKSQYKGNVVVEYEGERVEETIPYKFSTKTNTLTDGDSNGKDSAGATLKNLPLYVWILIGVIAALVILVIIMFIVMMSKRGNKTPPQQPIPYAQYYSEKKEESNNTPAVQEQAKEEPVRNVRGTIVNNYKVGYKDWTFVIKETDVLNPEVLENQNERVLMYACKESEIRKLKKFQSALAEDTNEENETNINNTDSKSNKKGKGKRR